MKLKVLRFYPAYRIIAGHLSHSVYSLSSHSVQGQDHRGSPIPCGSIPGSISSSSFLHLPPPPAPIVFILWPVPCFPACFVILTSPLHTLFHSPLAVNENSPGGSLAPFLPPPSCASLTIPAAEGPPFLEGSAYVIQFHLMR